MCYSDLDLHVKQDEDQQQGEVARRKAEAEIQKAQYLAEIERLNAEEVAVQEIDKKKIEIAAEAEAERIRREAKGRADATLMQYEAEAKGIRQVLEGKAEGYRVMVESTGGDPKAAATMLLLEKLETIVETQVEAIKNLKIDKITIWDGGSGNGDGTTSTANFFSNMIKSLPPLQDITKMAGLELPEYLGRMKDEPKKSAPDETDADTEK